MPNRIIREGIITSAPVNDLTWGAEVFYRRLLNVADDYGRFHANPSLLRAYCYPLQLNKVSDSDITKWLAETQKTGLVRVYSVDGKDVLELDKFGQRVRADKSKFPPMPDTCLTNDGQVTVTGQTSAHVVGVVVEGEGGQPPRPMAPRKGKTQLPKDFGVSARVAAWAEKRGTQNLDRHLEAFVSKCKAKDYRYVDWDEALMGAIRDDWARVGTGGKRLSL